ncbi:MAG TPA: TVP38/TMEM64 family protein [Thermoanaerobaculia bacterium]|nr:TVP38/TMEM64 family protein [Thermoanaerobaculia bacterium]
MSGAAGGGGSRAPWLRPLALLLVVAALLVAARALGLGARLGELRGWIEGLGWLGPVVFVLLYALAATLAVPASLLTLAAGAMFGSLVGIAVVIVGATLGASAAFAIARWFARDAVVRWLGESERFRRLDALTERHGAIVVAITRLVPLFPFNLLNYGFGLTRVRFGTYVLWSFLCMLPGTALYVVGADALTRGLAEGRVPWLLVGLFAATLALLVGVVARARRSLAEREAAALSSSSDPRA